MVARPDSPSLPADDLFAGVRRRKLKFSEFEVLVHAGAFDDERVELLFGELVEMSPLAIDDSLHRGL